MAASELRPGISVERCDGRTHSRLRFPRAIAAAVARTTLHLFSEGKAKCGFLLFLSSSEISGVGQLEAFNQIKAGVHSATWPDDQGRQLVLLSSSDQNSLRLGRTSSGARV